MPLSLCLAAQCSRLVIEAHVPQLGTSVHTHEPKSRDDCPRLGLLSLIRIQNASGLTYYPHSCRGEIFVLHWGHPLYFLFSRVNPIMSSPR